MYKRIGAFILLACLLLNSIIGVQPVSAEGSSSVAGIEQVRVIVENTTFTEPLDGKNPAWTGTLVDTWVDIGNDSTMMSAVTAALDTVNAVQVGAESNYISTINDLSAYDGGFMSGWMGTLNDWFTHVGFGEINVAEGTLEKGDEIRIMYTRDFGEDLGGSWSNNDKTVHKLSFSAGELSPEFHKDTDTYTLSLSAGTTGLVVTPTASNKNFQVRTSIGSVEYKRTAVLPVENGTVISVKCGDPAWPSMNSQAGGTADSVPAETYTITVEVQDGLNKAELDLAAAEAAAKVEAEYTADSYALLKEALTLPETTQDEIDTKVLAIHQALAGLVLKTAPVGDHEGLKELLLYTGFGSYQSDIEATTFFGTPNAAYPERAAYDQKTTQFNINQMDLLLNESNDFLSYRRKRVQR